jgi:hypothetical protein
MAEGLQCPTLRWDTGDDQQALCDFRRRIERWFTIKGTAKEKQHDFIIFQAGEKGEELSKTWNLPAEQLKDPKNVWDKFEQSVGVADNFRVHRLTFSNLRQKDGESVDEFFTRCKALALKCKFKDIDERLIDQLVVGTINSESRKDLLKEKEQLNIDQALTICRTQEAAQMHLKAFETNSTEKTVHAMKKVNKSHENQDIIKDCKYCGTSHMKRNCPAFKDKCNKCGRKGHWKIKCRKNSMQNNPSEKKHNDRKKQFHTVQEDAIDENYTFETIGLKEGVCVNTINSVINNDDIIISVQAQTPNANGYLQCKLDTGA